MEVKNAISELGPSENLLEFYRKKISEHERVQDELNLLLERYRSLANPIQREEEHHQLTSELTELREALSDINVFIHSERQQSTQLHFERERLKVDLSIAEKKLELLCSITNITNEELEVFIQNPKKKGILKHHIPPRLRRNKDSDSNQTSYDARPLSEKEIALKKHVDLLEQHLKESKNAWIEEKATLLEEKELQQKEAKAQAIRDQSHAKLLAARLDETQKLLQNSTQMALDAKSEMLKAKRQWLAEKDKLMTDLAKKGRTAFPSDNYDGLLDCLIPSQVNSLVEFCDGRHAKREIIALQRQLKDQEELRTIYEKRCLVLEQEKCKLREEKEAQQLIFKDKVKKIAEKRDLLAKQNEKMEQRRLAQAEGFSSDLRLMKEELKKIVQQFYKLTSHYCQSEELPDASQLKDLKAASALARNVHHAILQAKKRLVAMESFTEEKS